MDELVGKLQEQTETYGRDVAAPLLLAYLAYQNKQTYVAAGYLDTLVERSGPDPLIPLLKRVWLDTTTPGPRK
jgi:hypothetical protein